MDLGFPLRSLIPSLDAAVLEVIASVETPLSASAIWRASRRGTRAGQQPVLERLVAHGLVITFPAAVGSLYAFNRDHLLADAILSALHVRLRLVERLRDATHALDPTPLHVLLFGSFARGDADEESDIDLLIVAPNAVDPRSEEWNGQIDRIVDNVERWTGNPLQVLTHTETSLRRLITTDEPIVTAWRNDGIRLLGLEPPALLAKSAAA